MVRHVTGSDQATGAREDQRHGQEGHQIDTADLNILGVLQTDGRISNVDLSKRAGLSPPPTLRRVATLEECGFIKGVHAVLNPKALGYEVTSFILVGLTSQANAEVATFEATMQANPNVRECHALSGQRDFLLRCAFHDLSGSNDFVRTVLLRMPGVRTTSTSFAIAQTKSVPFVPLEAVEAKLSLNDVKALKRLAADQKAAAE
jgi:DNA-binding Lrp family transcriptional regulator